MAAVHQEASFEAEICTVLAANGWLYAVGDAQAYDRARALFAADLIARVQATQPKAWEALQKSHGPAAQATLLDRVRKSLDDRGTQEVLRNGVELIGLRAPLSTAQFKPAVRMNGEIVARYEANRLRVVRQVRYSLANENCIDLVLFLTGLPVAKGGAEDRLHPERGRRSGPVPLRPPAKAEGRHARAALDLPVWGAGPLRRLEHRSDDDHQAGRAGDHLPALQSGP